MGIWKAQHVLTSIDPYGLRFTVIADRFEVGVGHKRGRNGQREAYEEVRGVGGGGGNWG